VDLYVYTAAEIPASERRAIATDFASRIEIDNRYWEPGDEWIERLSGQGVDIMYRSPGWIEAQLARVLVRHAASIGYSTCFWWNVLRSQALYDPERWYAGLQQIARQPYPRELQRAARQHFVMPAPNRTGDRTRRLGERQPPRDGVSGELLGHHFCHEWLAASGRETHRRACPPAVRAATGGLEARCGGVAAKL